MDDALESELAALLKDDADYRKYWEMLPDNPLTRSALKELNRRNRLGRLLCLKQQTETQQPPDFQITFQPSSATGQPNSATKDQILRLKEFARHGGPDLRDLVQVPLTPT
jgi:hypothetical protein